MKPVTRRAIAFVVALCSVSLHAQMAGAGVSTAPASIIAQAKADVAAKNFAAAVTLLEAQPGIKTIAALRHALADTQFAWATHLYGQEQYARAAPHFQDAYNLDKGNRIDQSGNDLNNLGVAYESVSQYPMAITNYQQALPIYQQVGDKDGQARDLNNLGNVYYELSQYAKAIEYCQQALPIYQLVGDKDGQAGDLNTVGSAYEDLSEYPKAIACYQMALLILQQVGDKDGQANDLMNLGNACDDLSQYATAIGYFQQSLPIFQQIGDKIGQANELINLGIAYKDLSQYAKAISCCQQALPIYHQVGDEDGQAGDLNNLGLAHQYLSQYFQAIDCYKDALPIYQQVGDKDGQGSVLANLGSARLYLGQNENAIRCFQQALAIQQQVGDQDGQAGDLGNLGAAYMDVGQYTKAVDYHLRAFTIHQQIGDKDGQAHDLANLMNSWKDRAQPSLAIFYGKQAVDVFQGVRSGLTTLDPQTQQTYLESVSNTYHQLADLLISHGRLSEAEDVLAMLKGQELTSFVQRDASLAPTAITVSFDPAEDVVEARYQKLADPVTQLGQQLESLRALKTKTAVQAAQIVALQKQLDPAAAKFQAFLAALPTELPASAAPDQAQKEQMIKNAQGPLQRELEQMGPGTVALFTLVEPTKYRVIVVNSQTEKAEEYPIKATDLRKLVFAWRAALQDPNVNPNILGEQLSKILIGPIEADLIGAKAKTLLWSLDDVLRYVPMAALYDGKHYLVEEYRSAVFTGATLPTMTQAPPDWQGNSSVLLALGVTKAQTVPNPGGGAPLDFPALPGVRTEINDITRYTGNPGGVLAGTPLENAQFTQSELLTALAQGYPVVHIASHFDLGTTDANSFLLLGNGKTLTLADLFGQGGQIFQGVDLLTLSACQTGVSGGNGSEVESLAQLAQDQGAASILASLWPVSDATTPLLMRAFYQNLSNGTSKAEALRQAQLALLHGTASVPVAPTRGTALVNANAGPHAPPFTPHANAPYAHPYYWASFVLTGNWR